MLKNDIYELVLNEVSKATEDCPVTKDHLRAITGKGEREVRDIISSLRRKGYRIGSSSSNRGYWMCQTEAQYAQLRAEYLSRIATIYKTINAMDFHIPGQIEIGGV